MLIASLLPLLTRYSLGFDLVSGPDETVTLTIIPRKAEGADHNLASGESRPISITASAAEIDAELARGADGALGQLIASRKTLADQREAAEAARASSAEAAKAKPVTARPISPAAVASGPAQSSPPASAKPDEPASLW